MRITHLLILLLVVALSASLALPAYGADGAATFKAKCAACHGPNGEGKIGPKLQGTTVAADQIVDMLTKGNDAKKVPHKKPLSGLSADDAKAVADYVKSLK
jgi:mono/diheme cytochrome c family protein